MPEPGVASTGHVIRKLVAICGALALVVAGVGLASQVADDSAMPPNGSNGSHADSGDISAVAAVSKSRVSRSCRSIRTTYAPGIAKSKRKARAFKRDGNLRPRVKRKVYRTYRHKDRNSDGVICGVRRAGGLPYSPPKRDPSAGPSGDVLIAAAGDIACSPGDGDFNGGSGRNGRCRQKYVADRLAKNVSTYYKVLPLGDLQYERGAYRDFLSSYDRSWGQFNSKAAPVMGNHEGTGDGYFDYFNGRGETSGVAGERGKGWYALTTGGAPDVGWQILALNSECSALGCQAEQLTWLTEQLAATDKPCTLAYWHRPRFSSGAHGDDAAVAPLWDAVANHGADVVLSGHEHNYERMAPRDVNGDSDPATGVRQFVVGTGGKEFRSVGSGPHTQARNSDTFGYLEMTLMSNSYDWRFVRAAAPNSGNFEDSGSASCHG